MELAQILGRTKEHRRWSGHCPRGNAGRLHTVLIQHSPRGEDRQRQRGTVFRNCKSMTGKCAGRATRFVS